MNTAAIQSDNPFPGLRPFRGDEHHLFFGREDQTAALLQLLRQKRFLAVVGTSGSGKSSLVRAGMIAELYGGTMTQAGSTWEVIILRPGGNPIENLARALVDEDFYDADDADTLPRLLATLRRSRFGLVEAIKQSDIFEPGTNLLVVVDQFEELFRFRQQDVESQEAATAFVNLLLTASEQAECPIYVTLTMRSDYLGDCSEIPGLAEAVNEGEYLIPRLLRDQKRDAIENPVGVGGAQISPLLVQRLLNEVGDDPDQLPVLQHALMRMWDVWSADGNHDRPIELSDFEATGGLAAALSNHADEIYASLPSDAHRNACERTFRTLTEKGTDNRGIRRPTRLAQLRTIAGTDRDTMTVVLDAFRQSGVTFVMPGAERELQDQTVIDLSHESLMRGWERLRNWVEEEAQSARIFRRLTDTAALWKAGQAGLFRDPDLQIAVSWREQQQPSSEWAEQYGGQFDTAIGFLDSSNEEARAEEQAREAARQRELQQAQKLAEAERQRAELQLSAARRLRGMVAGFAVVAVFAIVASVVAFRAKLDADHHRVGAESAQADAELSQAAAVKNADAARKSAAAEQKAADRANAKATEALVAQSALQKKKFSSDMLLTERAYNTGNIGAASAQLLEHIPLPGEPDRRNIEWYLWWNASHQEASVVNRSGSHIYSLAISADGNLAADSHWNNTIRLRETANPQRVKSLNHAASGQFGWLRFSPDNTILAAVSRGSVYRFSTQNANVLGRVTVPTTLRGLAFSPTQSTVVSGGDDGKLHIWDTASWRLSEYSASSESLPIWTVAYSPDGRQIAAGTDGGGRPNIATLGVNTPLILWDTVTQSVQKSATGHTARINSVAWSPDGQYIASGSSDETVCVWDKNLTPVTTLSSLAWVAEVAFSPDGRFLVAGTGRDNAIRVWSTESWDLVTTIKGHSKPVSCVAFEPHQGDLWSASKDGAIKTWNVESHLRQSFDVIRDDSLKAMLNRADDVDLGYDGKTLFCTRDNQSIERYDLERGGVMPDWAGGTTFVRAAFSRNGELLVTVTANGQVQVWRTDNEEPIAETEMSAEDLSNLHSLAVSPTASFVSWTAGDPLHIVMVGTEDGFRHRGEVGLGRSDWRYLTISPDENRLALKSGFGFGLADISEFSNREARSSDQPSGAKGLPDSSLTNDFVYSSDSRFAAAPTFDSLIRLYNLDAHRLVRTFTGHSSEVRSVDFSEDGRRLVSASLDGTVRLWDVQSGDSLTTLQGHNGPVNWVRFTNDDRKIVSTSRADGTVRIWHIPGREELQQDPLYWEELALYHEQNEPIGQGKLAIEAYDRAIELLPGNAELVRSRAELHKLADHEDKVVADSLRLIALGETDEQVVGQARDLIRFQPLLTESSTSDSSWRYTFDQPAGGWNDSGFDASTWDVGGASYGSTSAFATTWDSSPDIWVRYEFELTKEVPKNLSLNIYCDDQASFYLNGVHAADASWISIEQQTVPCSFESIAALKPGRNILAIHCHNIKGDAGVGARLIVDTGQQRWIDALSASMPESPANVHLLQLRMQAYQQQGNAELAANDADALLHLLRDAVEAELTDPDIVWPTHADDLADLLVASSQSDTASDWQVLDVTNIKSVEGATLEVLDDGSVLASGTNPDSDQYTMTAETDLTNVTAIRLEALTHPSLPNSGPGRDNKNDVGNFSIAGLKISSSPRSANDDYSSVRIVDAWTDYTNQTAPAALLQGQWNVGGQGGNSHEAIFLVQSVRHREGTRLAFSFQFQKNNAFPGQNLGRFRLSVARRSAATYRLMRNKRRGDWDCLAAAYFLVGDTQALDHLLDRKPRAATAIGDMHLSAGQWEQAIDSYSRLISPDTTSVVALLKRGETYAEIERWDEAQADWRRAESLQPGILTNTFNRLRMTNGHWKAAAMTGLMLIEGEPDNRHLWLATAPTLVLAGDDDGYREFCERMVNQFGDTTDLQKAESTCKACLIVPGAVDLSRLPLKVFADALDQGTAPEWFLPWAWTARALVAYRKDDADELSPCLPEVWKRKPGLEATVLAYSIAALDRQRRGDSAGAREALEHVKRMVTEHFSRAHSGNYHDWQIAQILAKEAEELLAGKNTPDTTNKTIDE